LFEIFDVGVYSFSKLLGAAVENTNSFPVKDNKNGYDERKSVIIGMVA